MKRSLLVGSVIMAFAVATAALAADKTKSEEAFDRLAALKGEWKGQTDGVDTTLMYTLTANGSALMEQCRPDKGREMITMFTVDGDHLIATHYCSARNQPQMATAAITGTSGTSPTPFTPCGCFGFGTSTITVSNIGRSEQTGMR